MYRALLFLLPLLAFSACKPGLLPETSVPNTKQNRAVVAYLDLYRQAVENRSAQGVMELVAQDYFEDGATPQIDDDYGYTQLEEKLTKTFEKIENIHLKFHIQNIEQRDQFIDVVYYFVERALIKYPSGSQWMSANDVNRVVLRMKGKSLDDGFEIVSGL